VGKKTTTTERKKQHIKKKHNTHTTTIKNERNKNLKEEKPHLKTKNRKEKKQNN